MRRYLFSMMAALVCSASVYAVVASPEPISIRQGDGTTINVKMVGDEFHHYYTTLDGTPLRMDKKGMMVEDASVVEPSEQARHIRRATQQATIAGSYPLTGSPKSLVILVNFADLKFRYTLADFQAMMTESGYSKNNGVGSARDYFIACSDSIFSPQFDCYGPVTLSQKYPYYDSHTSQMIVEACNLVANQGVDLTQYDTDNDGRLDNVFVYYAGNNEAEGASSQTIWPHRSVVQTGDRVQNKLIYDYACTSELRGSAGNAMCGIGTFCHEFGHVLGLPDYYDTDNSQTYTVGSWDIMCSGSYNGSGKTPPSYTAGERFQLGWIKPVQLKDAGTYTLEPLVTTGQSYLIAKTDHNLSWGNANPNEYWLLENRQNLGWDRHSTSLPGTGMLIFHITYNSAIWGQNEPNNSFPLRYDIEEAGGVKGYSAQSDPFPGSLNVTSFTPMLHSGEMLEQPLTGITQEGQNIIFTFKSNGFMFIPTELPLIESTYNPDTKKSYTPASVLKVAGDHLDPNEDVTIAISGSGFNISIDSVNWRSSLTVRPNADSVLDQPVYVRYAPRKQVCDAQRGTISVRQGAKAGSYAVRATSERPVLISTPALTTIEEVTPTSFKVRWKPEEDAEQYFVTLYHMEDGQETLTESFEGFDDEMTVWESGWYTSFYRTTSKAKIDGSESMWFKENNEVMMSPIYQLPITNVSFWLSAPATTDSEVGFITLIGTSDAGADTLDVIHVSKNTKKYTYSKALSVAKGYRRIEMDYTSLGGEGVCLDAFQATFNKKTIYTYKGREKTIEAVEGDIAGDYTIFYASDLIPSTTYYVRLQCAENKGCSEHLSDLSQPTMIFTQAGEAVDSKHLTYAYDSINYDPARHVIYLPQSLKSGHVNIYSPEGELVKSIPVSPTYNIVPLNEADFRRGAMYMIKYMPEDKMGRKSPWIKIIFL